MESIERKMTASELTNLNVDGIPGVNLNKPKKQPNAREKFELELQKHEQEATKTSLPFARHAVRDDFNQKIKVQVDKQLREYGSVEKPEELKLPIIDWNKYSDLKNFDFIETHERPDGNLTKHNPGLNVKVKCDQYKFKGYGQTYKVMESGPDAITRAIKNRAKLDKSISTEINEVSETNKSKLVKK